MKLPDATCPNCSRPMEIGRLPIQCDECDTWLWCATDGERIYLPSFVPVARAQEVSEQLAQMSATLGMDAWLDEVAKTCRCCASCGEFPCGGCQQGAPCDEMPCTCGHDDYEDSDDDLEEWDDDDRQCWECGCHEEDLPTPECAGDCDCHDDDHYDGQPADVDLQDRGIL
ncbi:MAG TPA: hypothetical protein PKY30_10765 [Myxococcota bacterium]|nr:hypothetical protein [Myxococcota bacterium]HNH47512.1 hypothetical protein [Myxococcota bacterium]